MDEKVYVGAFQNAKLGRDISFGHPVLNLDVEGRRDGFASDAERQEIENIRRRYDHALQVANVRPLLPQANQTPEQYRHMLMQDLLPHASTLEQQRYRVKGSSPRVIEEKLLADILSKPGREGRLESIVTRDQSGREITEWTGAKSAWMAAHKAPGWVMKAVGDTPVSSLRI